jgi:transposase InsO family protein
VPLERGWVYLVVVMDWFSRAVLAWRLSNTLGVEFCLEVLEEALEAWAGISRWLHFHNHQRPHQALGYQTPMHVYRIGPSALAA